jgi:GR25 family glycosyltransferase involved in LPS biosynthesis
MSQLLANIRSYCIVLPEAPERTARCAQHFEEMKFWNYQFFDGIHAEKFGLKTVWPYEVDHPGSGFNIGFRVTGCWLSHFMLWSALNLQHEEHYHVMESDAKLPEDWRARMTQALLDAPRDFDMLYTGSCCCAGHPKRNIAGSVFQMLEGSGPQCTHSYIVAKKALPVLLATQRKVYAPIDASMVFHSHPLLKVYVVLPQIVDQFDTILQP